MWFGNHLFSEMQLLSLAEDHCWNTRYWKSTSSEHNRTMDKTVLGDTCSVPVGRESLNPGAAQSQCVTHSLYPSCFAHGGIQSSPLLCPNAGTCPASNRTLDYVPPNQHCSCATRIHPEECLCSVRF